MLSRAVLILTLVASYAYSGEQRAEVKYKTHYISPNDCYNDDVNHGLTGTKAYYGSGGFVLRYGPSTNTPVTFALNLNMNQESGVSISSSEWGKTANGDVCYYFASSTNGTDWLYASPKNRIDSTTQSGFEVRFDLQLAPSPGSPMQKYVEFYARCRNCSHGQSTCQVRPGANQANLRIAAVLKWTTDTNGVFTDCHMDDVVIDQSKDLGRFAPSPYYPTMQGSPPSCGILLSSFNNCSIDSNHKSFCSYLTSCRSRRIRCHRR